MTNTITNNVTQCSPLQCFESLSEGASLLPSPLNPPPIEGVGDQGNNADLYMECRCDDLFSLASAPLLFGIFEPLDPKEAELKFKLARDPKVRQALIDIEKSEEAPSIRADRIGNEIIRPLFKKRDDALSSGPLIIREQLALINDTVVAYKKQAELQEMGRDYMSAGNALLMAAGNIAYYARTEDNGVLAGLFESGAGAAASLSEETKLPTLEVEEYVDLTKDAVRFFGWDALEGARGSSKSFNEAIGVLNSASEFLKKWGYDKEASDLDTVIMPRIKLKFEVLKWLEGTKNWAGNSLRLKELRFEFVFKVMEDVLFEGSGEEKKGDVNDPNIQKVITSAVKSEVIKRIKESPKETNHHLWEVAKYYLVVGQYEEALKYLGASVDIKSRRKYVYEARDCDLMIDVARVAGLKAYEALAWEYKAHAYNGGAMVRIEASLKALETAAGIYKEIGMANEVEDRLSALRKDLHKQKESALRKRAKVTAQKGQPRAVGAEGEGPPRAVGVERPEGPEGEGRKGPRERGRAK